MRTLCMLMVASIMLVSLTLANVGENFARSGLALKGSGLIQFSQDGNYYLLDPEFEIFVQDHFSLSVDPAYSYQYNTRWNESYQTLRLGGGVNQYFVANPAAARGNAHCVGIKSLLSVYRSSAYPGNLLDYTYLEMLVQYTFYHFITSRIAPYVRLTYNLVVFDLFNNEFAVSTQGDLALLFGMSFHFPSRDYVFPK